MRKILVLGALGGVAQVVTSRLLCVSNEVELWLADLEPKGRGSDGRRVHEVVLDLFDEERLRKCVEGHEMVINGAGPYIRTALPVAKACLEKRVCYLDFSDDIEAFESMLVLDDEARQSGVPLLMGCGVSPGLTNVIATDLRSRFEAVEVLDVAWASGDEGGEVMGPAVLEHLVHIASGKGVRWRDGRPERFESMTIPSRFDMGGGLGEIQLWEIAHPEPLMLGRTYPDIPLIRCFGGIDPPVVMAVVRQIARGVFSGRVSLEQAISFMQATMAGRFTWSRVWMQALEGLAVGLRDKLFGLSEAFNFAGYALLSRHVPFRGGILCRISGIHDDMPATLVMRSTGAGPGTFVDSMAGATGTCAAAFALLALDGALPGGVIFPEFFDPLEVYSAFGRMGYSLEEIIEVMKCQ